MPLKSRLMNSMAPNILTATAISRILFRRDHARELEGEGPSHHDCFSETLSELPFLMDAGGWLQPLASLSCCMATAALPTPPVKAQLWEETMWIIMASASGREGLQPEHQLNWM